MLRHGDNPGVDPARAHYLGAAGRRYHEEKRGVPEAAWPWVVRLRAARFQPYVAPGDVVFEYGCGAGWNLAALPVARRLGHDVAEFLREGVERQGIEFVPDPAALPDGVADVVLCHHVLEHLWAPAAVLVELRRLLRPGGRLLVGVPCETGRRYRRFDPQEPNHHLYSWNAQTLGRLVTDCGYRVRRVNRGRYGYDRFAAVWAVRLRLGEAGFRWLRRLLITLRPCWEWRLEAGLAEADARSGA